jgi:hypothetical protein
MRFYTRCRHFVSNPFIAGHSFLPWTCSLEGQEFTKCFKPLHSGAFLLTGGRRCPSLLLCRVSNPFIAGHSFLLVYAVLYTLSSFCFKPLHSGAFLLTRGRTSDFKVRSLSFKPLHSGAFLLTCVCGSIHVVVILFQTPS